MILIVFILLQKFSRMRLLGVSSLLLALGLVLGMRLNTATIFL